MGYRSIYMKKDEEEKQQPYKKGSNFHKDYGHLQEKIPDIAPIPEKPRPPSKVVDYLSRSPKITKGLDFLVNNPVTQAVSGFGAGAEKMLGITYARRMLQPDLEQNLEQTRQNNPIASTIGQVAGAIIPGAAIEKAAVKALPHVFSGLGGVTGLAARGIAGGAGLGAIEGGLDSLTSGKSASETLSNMGNNAYNYALMGGAGAGVIGGVGKGIGKAVKAYKTSPTQGLRNIDEAYKLYKDNGIFGMSNPVDPKSWRPTQVGRMINDVQVGTKLKRATDIPEHLALPAPKGSVIEGYPTGYPLRNTQPLQLGAPKQPLMLKEGTIAQPPIKPVGLGDAPQGKFSIKPTEVPTNKPTFEEFAKTNKDYQKAIESASKASKARMDLEVGSSRARVTSANARWSSAAEYRDRLESTLKNKYDEIYPNADTKTPYTKSQLNQLEKEIRSEMQALEQNQYNVLKSQAKKGVESKLKDTKGTLGETSSGYTREGHSLNNQWYRDELQNAMSKDRKTKEWTGKSKDYLADYDLRDIAKKHLSQGYVDDMGQIPANEYYLGLQKQLDEIPLLREKVGSSNLSDFTPQNKTVEPIKNYAKQIDQYNNPNKPQPSNFKVEKPFQAFPGEVVNVNVPPKVASEFSKDIFNRNLPPKLKPNAKTLPQQNIKPTESNLSPVTQQGNINSPLPNKSPLQRTTTQNTTNDGIVYPDLKNMPVRPAKNVNAGVKFEGKMKNTNNIIDESIPQDAPIGKSKVITNTTRTKIPELQTPEGVKFTQTLDESYGIKPNKQSIDRANKMLAEDYEGMYNRIVKEGVDSAEDTMAGLQMVRDLSAGGNFDEAANVIKGLKREGANKGQTIQAFASAADDSLEGIALRGQKLVDSFTKDLKTNNPAKYAETMSKINSEVKSVKDVVGKNLHLLDINLQLFGETVDKELKQVMGKMYKKDYVDNIVKLMKEGKKPDDVIARAVKEKYGIPEFSGADLKKIKSYHDKAQTLDPNTWEYAEQMAKANDYIKDKLPSSVANKLNTYQFINLYLNTSTASKIFGGNITSVVQNHVKDIIKASVDNAISFVRGKPMTAAFPSIKTKVQGYKKRFGDVIKDRKAEVNTSPFDMSYDFDTKSNLTFSDKTKLSRFARTAENWTKFLLSIAETPFKQAIYDDSLRMIMKTANVAKPTPAMLNEAMEIAQKAMFANKTTATNVASTARAGINDVSNRLVNKILPQKYQIQKTKEFGIGNVIQPIIKTPINMASMAFDYSPLGMLKVRNQKQFSEQLSKAIIGSVFGIGAGYAGKKTGLMSGGIPRDADARGFAEDAGRQSYAWNMPKSLPLVGGKSVDVSYIQPLGMLQSFGAELASDNPNKQPFIAALDSLINQGMLQGFATMLGQKSSLTGSASENMANAITGGTSTLVPFSSAMNQASKSFDTVKRETKDDNLFTKNVLNKSMARTPFRGLLPPKISNTGEPVKEDGLLNAWLFPGKVKDIKDDAVTNELMRLYDQSGQTAQFPTTASNSINYKLSKKGEPQKQRLEPQQLADFKTSLGQENMKAIKKVIGLAKYRNANDKQKALLISNELSENKQKIENKLLKSQGIKEYKRK